MCCAWRSWMPTAPHAGPSLPIRSFKFRCISLCSALQDKRVLRMEKLDAGRVAEYGLSGGDWWAVQVSRLLGAHVCVWWVAGLWLVGMLCSGSEGVGKAQAFACVPSLKTETYCVSGSGSPRYAQIHPDTPPFSVPATGPGLEHRRGGGLCVLFVALFLHSAPPPGLNPIAGPGVEHRRGDRLCVLRRAAGHLGQRRRL